MIKTSLILIKNVAFSWDILWGISGSSLVIDIKVQNLGHDEITHICRLFIKDISNISSNILIYLT